MSVQCHGSVKTVRYLASKLPFGLFDLRKRQVDINSGDVLLARDAPGHRKLLAEADAGRVFALVREQGIILVGELKTWIWLRGNKSRRLQVLVATQRRGDDLTEGQTLGIGGAASGAQQRETYAENEHPPHGTGMVRAEARAQRRDTKAWRRHEHRHREHAPHGGLLPRYGRTQMYVHESLLADDG